MDTKLLTNEHSLQTLKEETTMAYKDLVEKYLEANGTTVVEEGARTLNDDVPAYSISQEERFPVTIDKPPRTKGGLMDKIEEERTLKKQLGFKDRGIF